MVEPQSISVEYDAWAKTSFQALDTHGRGYLYKNEVLEPIIDQGVQNNHSLDELITGKNPSFALTTLLALNKKRADEPINFEEYAKLVHGLIFLKRVYIWDLTIPHFNVFRRKY